MSGAQARHVTGVVRGWRFARAEGPLCVVGDVHGGLDKLQALWARVEKAVGGEEVFERLNVVFLGDYCDRGPDSKGVLEWMTQLPRTHEKQKHHFLCGDHDFALSAFLGLLPERYTHEDGCTRNVRNLKQADYSHTWREGLRGAAAEEKLYSGPGHDRMHLQGVRYAAPDASPYDSEPTFASYGVPYGDRDALRAAMPDSHLEFLADLRWVAHFRSSLGDVVAVHAGLEDRPIGDIDHTVQALSSRDPQLLHRALIEPLGGRGNVERLPAALLPPVPRKKTVLPPPFFLVSGHHGFVRLNGRRIILDMAAGRADRDLCALIMSREGGGVTHTPLTNDRGLSLKLVTSSAAGPLAP